MMVDFSYYGTSYTYGTSVQATGTSSYRSLYGYTYYWNNSDPLTWSGSSPTAWVDDYLPNLQFRFGQPVPVTPTSVTLSAGVWSGQITISQAATDIDLLATGNSGIADESDPFDVIGSSLSVAASLSGTDRLFAAWMTKYGLKEGENGDDDHDGKSNLVEYAYGTDPTVADELRLPQTRVETDPKDGKQYPAFTYHRRLDDLSLVYRIEISHDGTNWVPAGTSLEAMGTPTLDADGVTETVSVRLKTPVVPDQSTFFRLQVSLPALGQTSSQ
ncbi:MAG: hypothetical protein QM796_00840 [Chthoniobacteraceae bacterium]